MPVAAPGIAANDAHGPQPASFENAVFFHGLQEVFRTGRCETTARTWATDKMKNRGNGALVTTDEDADEPFHGVGGAGFKSSP